MNKSSLRIIEEFLEQNDFKINTINYIDSIKSTSDYQELPTDIIDKIISDAYKFSSNTVKIISSKLVDEFNVFLGRTQKNFLRKYLDYRSEKYFEEFYNSLNLKNIEKEFIKRIVDSEFSFYNKDSYKLKGEFVERLFGSIKSNDHDRVKDYLMFLYSRLLSINEKSKITQNELLISNDKYLKKELTEENYDFIYSKLNCNELIDRASAVSNFNKNYINLINKNDLQKYAVVLLIINQTLLDEFINKDSFFDYVLSIIVKCYNDIQNHKTFAIKINNIFFNNRNIKWELYSILTIFAEKFKSITPDTSYYNPLNICIEILERKYDLYLNNDEKCLLEKYFNKDILIKDLSVYAIFENPNVLSTIESCNKVNTGFTFIDVFILKTLDLNHSDEIKFIKNENEILLIFHKHELFLKKIPCPLCASLNVSGNSYPEIGVKSWECKNPFCSGRSKTNRGKRYSLRTVMMQLDESNINEFNVIPKSITKVFRKDVVENLESKDLIIMLTKYYSFEGDKILLLSDKPKVITQYDKIIETQRRKSFNIHLKKYINPKTIIAGLYKSFFNKSSFVGNFVYTKEDKIISDEPKEKHFNESKIIYGNSLEILRTIQSNSIQHMVTSPPYYNAREYSQWNDLNSYLNDMFKIINESFRTIISGGVFFFNIGDIFGNENLIVKSKMGEKRIPLGAYTILLFTKVGFELLDNVIWYKGEPQSNRHKNDGNYIPYYQRPANCYEHIFIFKKPGVLHLNKKFSENILKNNIVKFSPVIKMGKNGFNRLGHSAPYPLDLPNLSIKCFTNIGEIVLDPFSGSGTTVIAATKLNRIGIGIELNYDYFSLSSNLLESHFKIQDESLFS